MRLLGKATVPDAGSTSSSSSWHETVLSVSQEVLHVYLNDNEKAPGAIDDNASSVYCAIPCQCWQNSTENRSFLDFRWIWAVIRTLARARTVYYVIFSVIAGLLLGLWIGRKIFSPEERARRELTRQCDTQQSSVNDIPKHIAIIMDGNRRYGAARYGTPTAGHWDGSRKLLQVAQWCSTEGIEILTVYAFSTENWDRDPAEVAALMQLFHRHSQELSVEAAKRNIRVNVLSTDTRRVPDYVQEGLRHLEQSTRDCTGLTLNVCLSYGGRGELVEACKAVARDCVEGKQDVDEIHSETIQHALLLPDAPDVLIRTSGEMRMSNFLLWQLAYTELFFVDKHWPAFERHDLLEVIETYAKRRRRFGK